jgi:hypothetical protein
MELHAFTRMRVVARNADTKAHDVVIHAEIVPRKRSTSGSAVPSWL